MTKVHYSRVRVMVSTVRVSRSRVSTGRVKPWFHVKIKLFYRILKCLHYILT